MFDYSPPNDRRIITYVKLGEGRNTPQRFLHCQLRNRMDCNDLPRTALTATANCTNGNRDPHQPQPRTANRNRTACVKLLLGSTVLHECVNHKYIWFLNNLLHI